jgi:hypothetical protein
MPITTFRPGDVDNTNFRGIPSIKPVGLDAEASLYGTVANEFDKVTQVFEGIQKQKKEMDKRESLAQVKIAEKDLENVDPAATGTNTTQKVQNAATKQVVDAGVQGYSAKMEIDLQGNMARIAQQNAGNPGLMHQKMQAYIEETTATLPKELETYYRGNATREANYYLSQATTDRVNADVGEAKNTVVTLIDSQQDQLQAMPAPASPAAQTALELRSAKYRVALDNAVKAGYLTPGEAQLRVMEVQESVMASAIVGEIQRAPNKLQFALDVAAGRSGTYLDAASPKQRLQGLAAATTMANVEDQIQARKDREVERARGAAFVRYQKQILADPNADHTATLTRMLNTAQTPADMERYSKMKDFIENSQNDLYNKSSPKAVAMLDYQANKGILTQDALDDAFANNDPNRRIGITDYNRLSGKIDEMREGLTDTLAYRTFADRLSLEFPAPKKSGLDAIVSAIGRSQVPVGASTPLTTTENMSENERLQNETLLELQEAIRDGTITSPQQLTTWGNERLNMIRTQRGKGLYQPEIVNPGVKMAQDEVAADPALNGLYQSYKNDRVRFINDVRSGKLTVYQANLINRALRGEPVEQNQTLRKPR